MAERRAGRPAKGPERLSKNRTFRIRGSVDDKLQAAAAAAGRSVSEEIERRLERSFEEEEAARLTGMVSPANTTLARHVALCAALVESQTGKNWWEDEEARGLLLGAVRELIEPTPEGGFNREALADALANRPPSPATRGRFIGKFVRGQSAGLFGLADLLQSTEKEGE